MAHRINSSSPPRSPPFPSPFKKNSTSSNGFLQSRLPLSNTLSNELPLWRTTVPSRPTRLGPHPVTHLTSMPISNLFRVPGVIRPYYVHTPTCYVYESPMITSMPLGLYSMQSGVLNLYNQQGGQYYGGYGAGYRSMPVETPYSATALALQGGRYPATSMAVTNEMAYPYYNSPYSMYGTYGQRGIMPGLIM
jgi:hypothetical protein